jgi:RNA polymerase subunit RPABC4/transcription elongation factor Spt4
MKKKECPSCAMEVDADSKICPICSYEFPRSGKFPKWIAILLIILFLLYFLF